MSNIVERLRNPSGDLSIIPLCREAADEIIRLRADKDVQQSQARNAAYEADIERLQSDLDYMESKRNTVQATLFAALEENERLTAQLTGRSGYVFTSTMQEMSDTMTRQALEIERLKAENANLQRAVAALPDGTPVCD